MRLATPLLLASLLLAPVARAQAPVPGSCTLGTATGTLGLSDVEATVYNTGSLFYGAAGQAQYVVPRATGRSPMYAAGLWVGGRVGSEIRFAGNRYANFQFWPGPLGSDGRPVNPADCSAYDRIWVVSVADVAAYDAGSPATPDLAQWPYQLGAGVIDGDGNPDNYDLAGGDRPRIYGSQTAFWVMNDVGNAKATNPISAAIGLEVRVHAFVVASQELDLARGTFYRYTLVYKGQDTLEDVYVSLWADPDLGNATDDYVGTDTTRGMAFVYNADEFDETTVGYGAAPPAFGIDLLGGLGSAPPIWKAGPPCCGEPVMTSEYYNYQQGLWADGVPVTEGGDGRNNPSGAITTFAFPGDPVTGAYWSEENTGSGPNTPGDRRFIVTAPSFTMTPGFTRTFDVAMPFGHGGSRLASVTALRAASDRIQGLHDSGALYLPHLGGPPPTPPGAVTLLSPPDGADLGVADTVTVDWTAAPDATVYRVEVATDSLFTQNRQESFTPVDSLAIPIPSNTEVTYFWRVQALNQGIGGPLSEARRFSAEGPFEPAPADVQEWDAAGPITTNADGSATDPSLLASLNSTRTRPPGYLVGAQGAVSNDPAGVMVRLDFNGFLTAQVPNDYELRWVEPADGHAVFNRATGAFLSCYETGTMPGPDPGGAVTDVVEVAAPVVGGLPRMPFQLWEVTPEGTERPLMAVVLQDDADNCYGFTTTAVAGDPFSASQYERIYGTLVPYDEAALLANPAAVFAETQILDADHQAFGRLQVVPYSVGPARPPQAGTRIRVMTSDPEGTPVETPTVPAGDVAIEASRPNPIRGEATLRLTVGAPGPARVALYDVLGREVAVLLDGPVAAGSHAVALDGRRLAPGTYVVVVEAGEARASRLVTVVR